MADTQPLDDVLAFIGQNFPDIVIDPARVQGWYDEVASGAGRTADELRLDVIKHVIGDEAVDKFVVEAFADRGIDPETGDETGDERVQRVSDEIQSGDQSFSGLGSALDEFGSLAKEGTAHYGDQILPAGMRLVNVEGTFYAVGSVYGVELAYEIGDEETVVDRYGSVGAFDEYTKQSRTDFDGSDVLVVGSDDEIVGSSESLQAQFDRDMRSVGLESPPAWVVNDQEAMTRYVAAVNEGWSPERMWNAMSSTAAFKARFPGVETVRDQLGTSSWTATINEYTQRETAIRSSILSSRGPGADTSPEYVSSLVAAGWQAAEVGELLAYEKRVKDNPEAIDNLNEILAFQGLPTLSADDFVSFLQDQDALLLDPSYEPGAIFEAVNDALRFQALIDQGVDVDIEFAASLGEGTSDAIASADYYSEQARIAAIELARNDNELAAEKYGLSKDDVVAAMFGEPSASGKGITEVNELLEKMGRERAKAATGIGASSSYIDALGRLRVQGMSNL